MADKYDLQVNFALPKYTVRGITLEGVMPGETLEGEILLKPFEDVKCRGLWLEIGFWDRGQGTPNENRLLETKIHEGDLRKNQPFSYHLQFEIGPGAPPTYLGQSVKIEWFVRVRVDVPLWFDKRHEFFFNVLPHIVASPEDINLSPMEKARLANPAEMAGEILNIIKNNLNKR